jgi:hypothetical protein
VTLSKLCFYVPDTELGGTLKLLFNNSLKASTLKTYTSAQNRFLKFCNLYRFSAYPVSEDTLLFYISYLFQDGLKGSSIRVYLSAVRNLNIMHNCPVPQHTPKVLMALRGAATLSSPPSRKLPITFDILEKILPLLTNRQDGIMLSLAMTTAFFGCLRAGELCLPDHTVFNPAIHVCFNDITICFTEKYFKLRLKVSKTDKFSNGTIVHIGCSGKLICSYCTMCLYIAGRHNAHPNSPLFVDKSGHILTKSNFVSTTKLLLSLLGFDASKFSGHSFRAGAATTGANKGFDDWQLKMLGRWASNAFNIYLRNPKIFASFATMLAS